MNAQVYTVTAMSEITTTNAAGKEMPKCSITLQEPGKFGDTIMAMMFGEDCQQGVRVGDLVCAALRLSLHEYEGRQYQDVVVRSIVRVRPLAF